MKETLYKVSRIMIDVERVIVGLRRFIYPKHILSFIETVWFR